MSYGHLGPTLVGYQLTQSGYEYMMRLKDLGAVEGPLGDMKFNEALRPVIEALHIVMAGGAVEIKVTQRGNPDIVTELRERLDRSQADANEINKKSGYYVTVSG